MSTRQTLQLIFGFVVAGLLIVVLIPLGLWQASVAFDHLVGIQLIPNDALRVALAAVLALVGLTLGLWSNAAQVTIGKGGPVEIAGLEVTPKTQNLIVTGPYTYTRNPMLLGAAGFYYGIAVFLNSPIALAIVTLLLAIMLAEVKLIEEPRLVRDFGSDYEDYRRRVSMFIPWRHRRA